MNLLNKLSIVMAKLGCAGLRNASDDQKNNLKYVKAVVKSQGARSFQFASDFIRSDVKCLVEMVDVNPEIIRFAINSKELNSLMFAFKCMEKDVDALVYFNNDLQNKIIETLKTQDVIEGEFAGEVCVVDLAPLKADEDLRNIIEVIEELQRMGVLQK